MLTIQKIESMTGFTQNERTVAQFIIQNHDELKNLSITDIANATFTSPSTLVRLSQKCGYKGWRELKNDLIEEKNYIDAHFHSIDPNMPFSASDTSLDIVKSMTALLSDTIQDTFHLIDIKTLDACVDYLDKASVIYVYGLSHAIAGAYDFHYKMRNIGKRVVVVNDLDAFPFLDQSSPLVAHLFISYSGETVGLVALAKQLRIQGTRVMAITSIGDNALSRNCDYMIPLCTREKLFSKIATYTSNESIHYILDLLYSLLFKRHYHEYLDYKTHIAQTMDNDRISYVTILKEEKK